MKHYLLEIVINFELGADYKVAARLADRIKAEDLLEACRCAQEYIRTMLPVWSKAEDLPPVMHRLAAAIAKAENR